MLALHDQHEARQSFPLHGAMPGLTYFGHIPGTMAMLPRYAPSLILKTIVENILNRNGLYLIVGALLVAVIGLGIYAYREETKPAGVELKIGEGGVSVEEN
jgi:hypothetical protein